jgi:hypothetical protein
LSGPDTPGYGEQVCQLCEAPFVPTVDGEELCEFCTRVLRCQPVETFLPHPDRDAWRYGYELPPLRIVDCWPHCPHGRYGHTGVFSGRAVYELRELDDEDDAE